MDASLAASMCADELRNQYGEAPQEAINRCAGRLVGKTVENAEAMVGGVVDGLGGLIDDLLGGLLGR
ncbi:MAG: hypothetical protein WKF83_15880 [Nocardioidaceae bacterium]